MPKGRHIRTIRLEIPTPRTWAGHWDCFGDLQGQLSTTLLAVPVTSPGRKMQSRWNHQKTSTWCIALEDPPDALGLHLLLLAGSLVGMIVKVSVPAWFCGCGVLDFMPRPFDKFWNVTQGFTCFSARSAAINSDTSELKVLPWRKPCSAVSCNSNGHGWWARRKTRRCSSVVIMLSQLLKSLKCIGILWITPWVTTKTEQKRWVVHGA